ncbi:BglG family transcription antiterminator [Tissierellaceae bacterium HCP3S3_D8]
MTYERQKKIFLYLLNSDIGLSGNELSRSFNVSTRTIRSDIKFLNKIIEKYNIIINSSNHEGYYIPKEQRLTGLSIIDKVFEEENSIMKIPNTPSERFAFIIFKLSFSTDYISMEELANLIFVSKTTIYLDIKDINKELKKYQFLELEISPIKGLKLLGDERAKRLLIFNVLKRERLKDNLMLSKSFYYAFPDKETNLDKEILFVYETIVNVLNKYGYILTDKDVSLLVKDILISIKRIQMGFIIEDKIHEELNLTIAKALKKDIEDYFNISLDYEELEYFQYSFNTKRILNINSKEYVLKGEAEEIVEEFIIKVRESFNIDFTNNENFKNNLMLHLNSMIERVRFRHFEENSLKNQIKSNYPFAFEISMIIVPIIKYKLNVIINEAEVSYIALHVAVALENIYKKTNIAIICGSGLGTAQLVKSKMLFYYNEQINIVGYFPIYKLNNILKGEYGEVDLIVSTIPINYKSCNVPVVQVNPLINQEDLNKIRKYLVINPLIIDKNQDSLSFGYSFFSEKLFKVFPKEIGYLDAIYELSKLLKEGGYIDDVERFYTSVVERENLCSTILDEMVAIPHPMESMSKTTVVSVGILKKPITYKGKSVKSILLFAINGKEDEKLKVLYGILQEILESETTVKELSRSKNFKNFIENIKF